MFRKNFMKHLSYIFCFLAIIFIAADQPAIKYKKGNVYKDGSIYLKTVWDKTLKAYEVRNASDSLFLLLINRDYIDHSRVSGANKTGQIWYVEVKLAGKDSIVFEMDAFGSAKGKISKLASLLAKYDVIDASGKIHHANLVKLGNDMGKPHSTRRSEIRY